MQNVCFLFETIKYKILHLINIEYYNYFFIHYTRIQGVNYMCTNNYGRVHIISTSY